MTMPHRPSLGGSEGEGQVQQVQHGSGSVAKRIPTLFLLVLFLLRYCLLIYEEALWYGTRPIKYLTEMVIGHQFQEQAGSKEGQ